MKFHDNFVTRQQVAGDKIIEKLMLINVKTIW